MLSCAAASTGSCCRKLSLPCRRPAPPSLPVRRRDAVTHRTVHALPVAHVALDGQHLVALPQPHDVPHHLTLVQDVCHHHLSRAGQHGLLAKVWSKFKVWLSQVQTLVGPGGGQAGGACGRTGVHSERAAGRLPLALAPQRLIPIATAAPTPREAPVTSATWQGAEAGGGGREVQ